MIAEQMVPGRRIVEQQHRADVALIDIVGRQRPLDGALAGHGVALGPFDQRHAGGAELAVRRDLEFARQAGGFAALPSASAMTGSSSAPCTPVDGRRFRIGAAEFRMIGSAVVALAIVFPDELPVALLDDRALEGDLGLAQIDAASCRARSCRGPAGNPDRFFGEADEDVAADAFAMDRLQAVLALVEILAPSGGRKAASRRAHRSTGDRDRQAWRTSRVRTAQTREPRWRQLLWKARMT